MPAPKRAKRGKHRWVGLEINRVLSRSDLERTLGASIKNSDARVFDLKDNGKTTRAILKVALCDYLEVKENVNKIEEISTITSSGKIRLVRDRIYNN